MGSIVWIIVLSLFTAGSLVAFYELASDQAISIMVVGVIFFILMWFVMSSASSAELPESESWCLRCGGCCLGRKKFSPT